RARRHWLSATGHSTWHVRRGSSVLDRVPGFKVPRLKAPSGVRRCSSPEFDLPRFHLSLDVWLDGQTDPTSLVLSIRPSTSKLACPSSKRSPSSSLRILLVELTRSLVIVLR